MVKIKKVNEYILGGKPEITVTTTDLNGVTFIPSLIRISVQAPDGSITTVSGTDTSDVIVSSGYVSYYYKPATIGWYATETWIKDGSGREDTDGSGFEVIDSVIGA